MSKKTSRIILILISLLIIIFSFLLIGYEYFEKLKLEVFNDVNITLVNEYKEKNVIYDIPNINITKDTKTDIPKKNDKPIKNSVNKNIDYNKYFGVLEIPKITLKRGFYNIDSKYNNVNLNVSMVEGSVMPNVANGNLILMAHSGDAVISYFRYLYKLGFGDIAFITYNGIRYKYKIVNIYNVDKNGFVEIRRNFNKNTLTLITCTKDDKTKQTVYIFEKC